MLRENSVAKQQRIGQRLTRAMAKAHLDRRELAELTGYSEAQIVRWELGRAPLYPIELIKLCHALDVRPEWLLCWIRGDAAAAVGLVVGRRIPQHIGLRVDLSMTVLLACAFFDPAAALVLSHTIARMPIEQRERARLSASWSMHRIWLGSRRAGARVEKAPLRRKGDAS